MHRAKIAFPHLEPRQLNATYPHDLTLDIAFYLQKIGPGYLSLAILLAFDYHPAIV